MSCLKSLSDAEGDIGTWAQKIGSFSWEVIDTFKMEYEKKFELSTYGDWKAWLMVDAKLYGFEGCSDNWLFAMSEHRAIRKISRLSYLGVTAYATVQETKHKSCGKHWLCYEIMDADLDTTLAICGYKFKRAD